MTRSPSLVFSPIFVVGVGRSGTTLVQAMLAAHPDVAMPPETSFLRTHVASGRIRKAHRTGGLAAVQRLLAGDHRLLRTAVAVEDLLQPFSGGEKFQDSKVYERLLQIYAQRLGKARVGDKDPRLVEFIPYLFDRWPHAFLIHVLRDPRDVLASRKKAAWSRDRSVYRELIAMRSQFDLGRRFGPKLFGERYTEVRYESLIANPEVVLRDLAEHLQLPFSHKMLEFQATAQDLVAADEREWKQTVLGPLLSDNVGQSLVALTSFELTMTERVCRSTLHDVSSPEQRRRTRKPAQAVLVAVLGSACILLAKLYELFRLTTQSRFPFGRHD